MNVVHLTSSQFLGGPERQMLGLAQALPPAYRTIFVSFSEEGRCRAFLNAARLNSFEAVELRHDMPRLFAAHRELTHLLRHRGADLLCCHGYKANVVGRRAARRAGVPVLAVSRGWTGERLRVRLYEVLDRLNLRGMDHVVCVSWAQAAKVRRAGVPPGRVSVIHNAIRADRFATTDPACRGQLQSLFPSPPARIVGAAGRLSPEKGFEVLVDAAARVSARVHSIGFVLFGDGPLRQYLEQRCAAIGLRSTFVLAGFRADLDRFLPFLDLFVLPSYTEGLPNVVLEAFAAQVPVVATAVGGTPELVEDGVSGFLVPPGDAAALADRILETLALEERRRAMGLQGRRRVIEDFTFAAQGRQYQALFQRLVPAAAESPPRPQPEQLCESIG